jgi:pimeloyl-ACP methyl ester carboxylesterase
MYFCSRLCSVNFASIVRYQEYSSCHSLDHIRTSTGGSNYVLSLQDSEVYRRPSMLSGDTGFALSAATRGMTMLATWNELEQGFATWDKPIGLAFGMDDKYLTVETAERFIEEVCPSASLDKLEGAGHFAQEDFAERLATALVRFLRGKLDF